MDYRLLFPSSFLSAVDLHGKDVTLTIRRVLVEELQMTGGKKQKKPCVWFEETKAKADKTGTEEKRLVLNVTNARAVAKLYGNEVNDWSGKRITLYPTTTSFGPEVKDCIRVRETAPDAEEQAA